MIDEQYISILNDCQLHYLLSISAKVTENMVSRIGIKECLHITNLCIMVSVCTENLFDSFSLLEKLGHGPRRLVHTALGRLLILGNLDTYVHAIIIKKVT